MVVGLLNTFLHELAHHGNSHLLHQHERVHHHHLLPGLGVLIRTVHARARICKPALDLGVQVHALVTEGTLREELTLLGRVLKFTLRCTLVAVGEVPTPNLLFARLRRRTHLTALTLGSCALSGFFFGFCLPLEVTWVDWSESLESLLSENLRLVRAHLGWLVGHLRRGRCPLWPMTRVMVLMMEITRRSTTAWMLEFIVRRLSSRLMVHRVMRWSTACVGATLSFG